MNAFKVWLAPILIFVFASVAMAATVTVNFSDGPMVFTRTGDVNVESSGNVTLSVTDPKPTGAPPPPGAPTCSLTANPTSVTSGGTTALSWTITNGPADGTFNLAPGGTCTNFTGSSSGSCTTGTLTASTNFGLTVSNTNGSSSCYVSVTVTSTSGDLPGTTLLIKDIQYDLISISAGAYKYYKIVVNPADQGKTLSITLGSRDYTTKQDIITKKGLPQIDKTEYDSIAKCYYSGGTTCTPGTVLTSSYVSGGPIYWFILNKGATYRSFVNTISSVVPDTYYIIVVNRSSATGAYRIFYNIQ